MQITFACDNCGTEMEADSSLFGSASECPSCAEAISIPQPTVGPGTTIGGFAVTAKLGSGAMGEVFLAQQLAMDRQVALKVLPAQFSADKERVDRFLQEARMSAKLDHPNIVTVLDAGEDTGFYYLAMQYVKGETVEDRMKRFGRLEEKEALNICMKVASGLGRAWSRHQMLHRDIKPANIMVDEFGEPKLLDMGLAKTMLEESHITVTGMIVGTPLFMSPEQGKGQSLDCRADIYSLGATLYAMVTGAPPYQADSVVAILAKHAFDPVPDARRRNRELTEGCAQLIEKMMAKDLEERLQDWDEVAAAVKAVRAGRSPVGAKPRLGAGRDAQAPTRAAATKMGDHDMTGDATMAVPGLVEEQRKKKSPMILALGIGLSVGVLGAIVLVAALAKGKADKPDVPVALTPTPTTPSPTPTPEVTPDPTPTPTPQAEPTPAEIAQERRMAAYRAAERYLQRRPQGHDEVIAKYESLLQAATGSPYEDEIRREIGPRLAAVTTSRTAAVDAQWNRLRGEALARVQAGDGEAAIAALRSYRGPWAEALQSRRTALADELEPQVRAMAQAAQPAAETDAERQDRLYGDVATAVFAGDLSGAAAQLEAATRDERYAPIHEDLRTARRMITVLQTYPAAHLKSFADRKGEGVTLTLKDGSTQVMRIDGAENGKIFGAKQLLIQGAKPGWGERIEVAYTNLHYSERLKLLGKSSEPVNLVARALLAVEAQNYDWAGKAFAAAKTPLAEMLTLGLTRLAGDSRNVEARQEVSRLLESAGLAMNDPFTVLRTLRDQGIDASRQSALRPQVETFLTTYADTDVGAEYGGLLAVAAGLIRSPSGTLPVLPAQETPVSTSAQWEQRTASAQRQLATEMQIPREVVNRAGIRFRLIPRGLRTGDGYEPEPFYLSVTELTEAQWHRVTGQNRGENRADTPVQDLRWSDVLTFITDIQRYEGRSGLTYRVPTYNEWRYAARAGLNEDFPFTGGQGALARYANHLDASAPGRIGGWDASGQRGPASDGQAMLAPVGSYPANPLGLHDMVGNVMEYTLDLSHFPDLQSGNSQARQVAGQIERGDVTLLSGGSWFLPPASCAVDVVIPLADARQRIDGASALGGVGMRLLLTIEDLDLRVTSGVYQQPAPQPTNDPPNQHTPRGPDDFSRPPRDEDQPPPGGRRFPRR